MARSTTVNTGNRFRMYAGRVSPSPKRRRTPGRVFGPNSGPSRMARAVRFPNRR